MQYAILQVNPLQCSAADQAYCDAFNFWFDLFITFGVYTLPVWAALRLVTRA